MQKYILRRVLIGIPVFISITIIIFGLIELAPGDITDYFIRPELNMTDESEAAIRARFGLDQPLTVRYVNWLAGGSKTIGVLGIAPAWTDGRDFPAPQGRTFRELYAAGKR